MYRPAYKLTVGDRVVDTTDEPQASTVVELGVDLDMEIPADRVLATLGQVDGLNPQLDDDVVVELGYAGDGSLVRVFTGSVTRSEPGLLHHRVTAHSPAASLLRTFVDQTYENKTAGEIVRELSGEAGVDVATAEDGIAFPAYVVDGRRNIHVHMEELAALCGFDLYVDTAGELVFKRFVSGNTIHGFEYARHVLELDVSRATPVASSVEAWGESAGGGGAEAWAWLTKDFSDSMGSAGSDSPVLLVERPALRDAEAAQAAADARLSQVTRQATRGRLLSYGRPEVQLGDAVRLSDAPSAELNGTFQVRSVKHRIDKVSGFTTTVGFRSMG